VDLCLYITREMLHGLECVHRAKDADGVPLSIVHRDVSPSNVYVSDTGEVKLGDFGVAHLLEADIADIVVDTDGGTVGVAGVPAQALSWAELAARAAEAPPGVLGDGEGPGVLAAEGEFDQGDASFPFGAHIAAVEVDLDHRAREDSSRYSPLRLTRLALHVLAGFWPQPIQWAGVLLGVLCGTFALVVAVWATVVWALNGDFPGQLYLGGLVLGVLAVQGFILALVGEYLGRIQRDVEGRPLYTIERELV